METKILTQEEFAHEILALRDAAADQIGAYLAIGHQAKISDDRKGRLSLVQKQREALEAASKEMWHNEGCEFFAVPGHCNCHVQKISEALALTTEPTA